MDGELVTTDEAILDSIGEGDEQTTDESTSEESTGAAENTTQEASTADGKQSTDNSNDGQQQQPAAGPQDLVDAAGNVIATGGKERRFYETAKREKQRADNTARELETVKAQLSAVENSGTLGTQYSLSPEELTTGAQLISSYKNNPVETIQYMLTQAQSNGYNVDAIVSGGTDMAAVKTMLDNALAPFTQAQQREADTQQATQRATQIYNDFSSKYPDAKIHEDSLSRLMSEDSNLNVDAAYLKLQNFYLQKGLDWTKSLATLQTEANAAPAKVNTPPQPPEAGGVAPNNVTDTANVADVSTSTGDIIKDAMREAGMNIN